MKGQKIHVIGVDDINILFRLLGIKGTVIKDASEFLHIFKEKINNPAIGMIIVALNLPQELIEYIIDFKLNNISPFVYYLPDIFQPNIEKEDLFLDQIIKSIKKIIA
ncbi:MAG: V-type ATP synthase subunit F [Promethearchaeota archaeon]